MKPPETLVYVLQKGNGKIYLDHLSCNSYVGIPQKHDVLYYEGRQFQVVNRTFHIHLGGGIKQVDLNVTEYE
ncbi:hypothetical protein [Fibrisoma limi]|uniref:hypothetical protein n=1 Tax=Fibrisoma limi TaxID=663275 RepID=UPI000586C226|nr:hypothetical protein [Fibrisoma limi]